MRSPTLINILSLTLLLLLVVEKSDAAAPQCTSERLGKPMSASLHKVGDKTILLLAGGIKGDTGKLMRAWISRKNSYSEVWLCSGGGAVSSGIEIGEALNRAKATVRTPNGYFCASACTIASMGGYVRIIDPKANFITHASSSASGFGIDEVSAKGISYTPFIIYRHCKSQFLSEECQRMRRFVAKIDANGKYRCQSIQQFDSPNPNCMYFDLPSARYQDNLFFANAWFTMLLALDANRFLEAIKFRMHSRVKSEVELVNYFHKMLLDGKAQLLNDRAYQHLYREFVPKSIYHLGNDDPYYRDFENDVKALESARKSQIDWYALWQAILTDTELSLKAQLTEYVKAKGLNLGPANREIIKLYDSMRTCQIQSSCKLEPHTAFSLGYHNIVESD